MVITAQALTLLVTDWNQDEHLQWLSELALRNPIVNASLPGMLHHLDTWFIKNETWGVEWILPFLCQNLTHLALDCSLFDECLLTLMNAIASTDQIEEQVFRALDLITAVPFRIWLWRPSGAGPLTSILVLDDLIRRASSTSCCSCALCPEKLSLLRGSRVRDVGSLEIAKAFKDVTESALEEIQFHSSYISPGSLGILLPKLPRLAGYLESHERPRGHPRGQDADWSHQATLQRLVAWKPKQLRKLTLLTAAEDCPVGVQYLEWDQIIASLKELSSLQELRIFVKWLRPRVFETLPSTVRLLGLQTWTVESIQEMKDSAMEMVEKLARGLSVRYTHSPLALEHILLSHTTPRVLRKLRKAADYSVLISENASLDFEWWDGHCTMCRHNPCQYPEERLFGFAETSSH